MKQLLASKKPAKGHNVGSSNNSHLYRAGGMFLMLMVSIASIFRLGFQLGKQQGPTTAASSQQSSSSIDGISYLTTLGIPQGEAQALPSIRVSDEAVNHQIGGTHYGGKGDKEHLGGFTKYDAHGVSPATWRYIVETLGVKSVMDVGCGKGVSTLYFHHAGAKVLCLEGSHDAVTHTLLPDPSTQVVEHDFSRGPYWPAETYDAVYSVEFLEHVGRNFQFNYIQAFRKAALIFVSHSQWGGWHHVEVHQRDWWVSRFQLFGFTYSEGLTQKVKDVCLQEKFNADKNRHNASDTYASIGPNGDVYDAQHIWLNLMVFINPAVASLPKHAHLLAEPGCPNGRDESGWLQRQCDKTKGETELPESYLPLKVTQEQHQKWLDKIKAAIASSDGTR
ncbi:expressed unknown protein [Seminavis robusta]|uniref:Methyltransferase type 11 domain-containing protein n=1 Tax=Seminavis robusta TaxID=568900 RepID=A0A9N8ECU4_9STRA|nr:expressed unknown protein [Seminavis robusta]|eukprot:Sro962_g225070.1 n/a (391) ;mRNA; f:7225-8608